jgi:hypothetical protein
MSKALAEWMMVFLTVTILFTSALLYFDAYNKAATDHVLHQAMKEASISGSFSEDIISKMESTLINEYNFAPEGIIEIKGTLGSIPRGGFIDAEITIKRSPIFVINIFNQGNPNYRASKTIMSESM